MAVTITVPPSTTKLIALADLKAILRITDSASDALLGNIIQRGSDAIARFCNRVFTQRTIIETLPGPGGWCIRGSSPRMWTCNGSWPNAMKLAAERLLDQPPP